MGATGTGAEPAPPIPSEPWGRSGHLLRRRARWDLALKTNTSFHFTHESNANVSDLRVQPCFHVIQHTVKGSNVVIHTFLRAVCVCAVGLRLPELKEKLQREQSRCNRGEK